MDQVFRHDDRKSFWQLYKDRIVANFRAMSREQQEAVIGKGSIATSVGHPVCECHLRRNPGDSPCAWRSGIIDWLLLCRQAIRHSACHKETRAAHEFLATTLHNSFMRRTKHLSHSCVVVFVG